MALSDYVPSFIYDPQDEQQTLTPQQLAARRSIAIATMAGRAKQPAPTTVGAGLTALGQAVGDRMRMAQLERMDARFANQRIGSAGEASALGTGQPSVPPTSSVPMPPIAPRVRGDIGADPTQQMAGVGNFPIFGQDDNQYGWG